MAGELLLGVRYASPKNPRAPHSMAPLDYSITEEPLALVMSIQYLEVVVLTFLLSLEPQPRKPAEVFLADRLVHRGASPDALAIVVRDVRPPVRLYRKDKTL